MEGETQVRMSRHENTRDTLLRCAASPTEIRFISQRRDVGLADIILDKCVRSHGKRRRGGKMPAQYERARPLCFQIASIFRHAGKSRDNYISISHESRDYIPLMQSKMMMQLNKVNMLRANKITLYILNMRKKCGYLILKMQYFFSLKYMTYFYLPFTFTR